LPDWYGDLIFKVKVYLLMEIQFSM